MLSTLTLLFDCDEELMASHAEPSYAKYGGLAYIAEQCRGAEYLEKYDYTMQPCNTIIMGRGSRPICRVGPKTPQNKMAATVS